MHSSQITRVGRAVFSIFVTCAAAFAYAQNTTASEPVQRTLAAAQPASLSLPSAPGLLSQDQMKDLIQRVVANDIENDKKQRDYTYIERDVENNLDGKGNTKSTETKTYEVLQVYGEQVQRLIEKDDKPISAKEAAKEEEKIEKIINKRKNESENDRRKRAEREEKDHEEGRQFEREIADAYNFTLLGTELVGGRETWAITAEPRPGFVPHMKYANFLPKFRGRLWIDKADVQMAKMDVECLDTVSWGLFLARFHRGSHFMIEQTRVNDEVWLPRQLDFKIDLRLALLKNFKVDAEQTFRDYKKFRTDAKIVGIGEVQQQK
ncbi:MAG TPA: hypothetical protein VH196_07785 [Terriglobales bacterium]|jgi:hypothetical protein|nr:hypothetical protein [Terriglobales bacterium]